MVDRPRKKRVKSRTMPSATPTDVAPVRVKTHLLSLSNELITRIIDFLYDDLKSLKSCSLTCKLFLDCARHNLFRILCLNARNCQKFMRQFKGNDWIGKHVKLLQITVHPQEQQPTWVDQFLPDIAKMLPKVQELHMKGKALYMVEPVTGFKALNTLCILGCEIEDLNAFCKLMGSFPHLRELYTNEIFVYRSAEVTAKPLYPPTDFRSITFNSCRIDPIQLAGWMVREGYCKKMEYLACCPIQRVGVPPVSGLTHAAGPALKHLKLALVGMQHQGGFADLIEETSFLSENTQLSILEFGSPAAYAKLYEADDMSFSWFPSLLRQANSNCLDEVAFNLWGEDVEKLESADWDEIVTLLGTPRFASLKRIAFHVWGEEGNTRAIIRHVSERFTSFQEKGLVVIDSTPDIACVSAT